MANLVLTTACNRQCVYCFAGKNERNKEMSVQDAIACMELARTSGRREIRLLGGEPTLHPLFPEILLAAQSRGLDVLVFSNGLMSDAALQAILKTEPDTCRVMINLNVGGSDSVEARSTISSTALALGQRAFVGVNIHSVGLPLSEAAEFAKKHGLSRNIRLGLAHPRLDGKNHWLSPLDYRRVGLEIEAFAALVYGEGFSLSLDCGFVPCMFSPSFFELTGIHAEELGLRCGPIPDILPDMTAVHCFPLSDLDQMPLSGVPTLQEMHALLMERMRPFQKIGVFRACSVCSFRECEQCSGGCLSAAMLRTHSTISDVQEVVFQKAIPAKTPHQSGQKTWTLPYIDQSVGFWEALMQEHGAAIESVYFPIGLDRVGSGRPRQSDEYLVQVMRSAVVPLAVLVNPIVLRHPLDEIGDGIIDELARLHETYGVKHATIADVRLAERVRGRLPEMKLTASCLLEISEPSQARSIREVFDVLVPATRMIRYPERLASIRSAFGKPLRLLVNEGCLNDCLDRKQHFYEMGSNCMNPRSLCAERLAREPWLRLTGAWALPQHLDLYDSLTDKFKLAGRVTLKDPEHYRRVVHAYISRKALWPHEIGGGPASPVSRISVSRQHFQSMLSCDHICDECSICRRLSQYERQELET